MGKGFFDRVRSIIDKSDIVLEVLDSRFPTSSRNPQLEQQVVDKGKILILVLNKCDLISKRKAEKIKAELGKEFPLVFVSAMQKRGTSFLREEIGKVSKGKECTVSVVGFPNTGKSSVINMLSGKHAALTSAKAGFTRGEQLFAISDKLKVFDTPGVIPYDERDTFKLALIGSKNIEKISDPEHMGLQFMQFLKNESPETLKKLDLNPELDNEQLLEDYARKKNRLLKGGIPDTVLAGKLLIQAWQKGKIKF